MVRVSVVGPREKLGETADLLHRLNLVHIEEPEESEYFRIGEPHPDASVVSRALVQMRSFISHLKLDPSRIVPRRKFRESEIEAQLKEKLDEYQQLIGERIEYLRSVDEKIASLQEQLNQIEPLKRLGIPARLLKGYKTLRVFVGFVKENPTEKFAQVTSDFEVFATEYEKELVVAVFVKAEYGDEFLRILQECGYREIQVPDVEDFEAKISEIEKEIESLKSRKEQVEKEIEEVKVKEAETLLAIEEYLSSQMDKYELPLRTLVSKYSFVLVGYLPAKALNEFKAKMDANGVAVEVLDEEGEPPTKLSNPAGVRNFELLTTTFGIPKYKEIDPTVFIAIFFPIFFGMMLGDIGYGLLVTVISLYLKRVFKTEGWQRMLN
ncbi:V-type ATPase 116kDa subunit family protein, partial [Archaeoglobus sp.]